MPSPRHPSQLYEAFFEGVIIFLILINLKNKNFIKNKFGIITSFFLILYGTFRILIGLLREPDSHIGLFFDYISMGQILSLPLIFLGVVIYIKKTIFND